MSENWNKLLGVLSGEHQHPVGRCVSYAGILSNAQLERLCAVLGETTFRGGLRLYGTQPGLDYLETKTCLLTASRAAALGHTLVLKLRVLPKMLAYVRT